MNDWEHLDSYRIAGGLAKDKRFLGSKDHRACRFCGGTSPSVTFKKRSHVIPEAFANRSLFSYEECDTCNALGGAFENDLAAFLSLPRSVSRLPGKDGMPKLRHAGEESYVKSERVTNLVGFHLPRHEPGLQVTDDETGTLHVSAQVPTYRRLFVAKALGRMAAFVLDRNAEGLDRLTSWLRGKEDWFPIPFAHTLIPDTPQAIVSLSLFKLKSDERNVITVCLYYASHLLTMPIPLDQWNLPEPFPIMWPGGLPTTIVMVEDDGVTVGDAIEMAVTYEGRSESPSCGGGGGGD